jgi:hypothetical protein
MPLSISWKSSAKARGISEVPTILFTMQNDTKLTSIEVMMEFTVGQKRGDDV